MPEDNHATIQALLNATADAVILIDLQGTLLALNDEAARRRGSTKAGLLGANLYATLAPELREGRRSAVEKIARTGQPVTLEERHGDRFFHVSMYPVLDEAGAVVQIASYSHDRTDAFRREAELVLAKEAAEAANMAKTQFLSNMSHELRTPLNGILGIAQIGKAEDVSPDTREMFQIIQESGMKLLRELNNLIDLASMERRSIEPLAREFRLNDLLEMVCRSYRVQAGLNGTDLRLETTCRLPELVVGDEYRLSQILSHLLSNALRFTHEGSVVLRAECDIA
ncbi:MAG: histidine kinase dimerization/phospho-acceptor domain-containing protein, partial [Desulfovibrionaceae bacterium]